MVRAADFRVCLEAVVLFRIGTTAVARPVVLRMRRRVPGAPGGKSCHTRFAAGVLMDMQSTTRIPKAELTGVYGALVKRMSRKFLGEVAEPVEVAWHNRKVVNFSFLV